MEKDKDVENSFNTIINSINNTLLINAVYTNPMQMYYQLMFLRDNLINLKNEIEDKNSKERDNLEKVKTQTSEEPSSEELFLMKKDSNYRNQVFENKTNDINDTKDILVLSIDIRRSTFYLENSLDSARFAKLIGQINRMIIERVNKYYGIIDKFTGDGFLVFFTNSYSGKDYFKLALLCSCELIREVVNIFLSKEENFIKFPFENGIGIGIDVGDAEILTVGNDVTYIGRCVVNSCRICEKSFNQILLNNQAYHKINKTNKTIFTGLKRIENEFKNDVSIAVYEVSIDENIDWEKPEWAENSTSDDKSQ
jgi:class 3 adenylate cyclase